MGFQGNVFEEVMAKVAADFVHRVKEERIKHLFREISNTLDVSCTEEMEDSGVAFWRLAGGLDGINKAHHMLTSIYDSTEINTIDSKNLITLDGKLQDNGVIEIKPEPQSGSSKCHTGMGSCAGNALVTTEKNLSFNKNPTKKESGERTLEPAGNSEVHEIELTGKRMRKMQQLIGSKRKLKKDLAIFGDSDAEVNCKPGNNHYTDVPASPAVTSTKKSGTCACPKCFRTFASLSNMYRHLSVAHQGGRIKCPQCTKYFACKSTVERHLRVVHQNLRCIVCYKIFDSDSELDGHTCPGQKESHVACGECGKSYRGINNLNKHRKIAHQGVCFQCDVCTKAYKSKENLFDHYRTQHGLFKCTKCSSVLDNEHQFADHMLHVHQPQVDLKSDAEIKEARGKILLTFKKMRCSKCCNHCGKVFANQSSLGKHIRVVHEKLRVSCDTCSQSFCSRQRLLRHKATEHDVRSYPCCLCTAILPNRRELARHQKQLHKQLVHEESFQCEFCGKSFLYDSNLRRHIKNEHEGVRFPCSLCDKEYKSKQRLDKHVSVGHGGRRYVCGQCPRVFRSKDKLKEHTISSHTANKPFECAQCSKKFTRRSSMNYHTSKFHSGEEILPAEATACSARSITLGTVQYASGTDQTVAHPNGDDRHQHKASDKLEIFPRLTTLPSGTKVIY